MGSILDLTTNPARMGIFILSFTLVIVMGGGGPSWSIFLSSARAQSVQQELPPKVNQDTQSSSQKRVRTPRKRVEERVQKTPTPEQVPQADKGVFEFHVDDLPKNSDSRPTLQFKDGGQESGGVTEVPEFKSEELPESEVFSVYPGYPKHQVALGIRPYSVSTNWSYSGQDFAFTTSSVGYGVTYSFQPTPRLLLEAEYSGYGLEAPASSVDPYIVKASSTRLESVFFKGAYCFFGDSSFFRQLCPGIDIGYDTYPVLDFVSSTNLQLSQVRDIILGLNLAYQIPMTDLTRLRIKAGYNRGTGSGNSGTLTSKQNTSYFLLADVVWSLKTNHDLILGMEYRSRPAKISRKSGQNTDTWETKSTIVGVQVAYQYSF